MMFRRVQKRKTESNTFFAAVDPIRPFLNRFGDDKVAGVLLLPKGASIAKEKQSALL
jgi:hypothetical protein